MLRDLARKYAVAKVISYRAVPDSEEPEDLAGDPSNLVEWSEFHEAIEGLPDEEREIDLPPDVLDDLAPVCPQRAAEVVQRHAGQEAREEIGDLRGQPPAQPWVSPVAQSSKDKLWLSSAAAASRKLFPTVTLPGGS